MKPHNTKTKSSKPIGKRTYTLKELAQRNFAVNASELSDNKKPIFNLVNIQEDLLETKENERINPEGPAFKSQGISCAPTESDSKSLNLPIELVNRLIMIILSHLTSGQGGCKMYMNIHEIAHGSQANIISTTSNC